MKKLTELAKLLGQALLIVVFLPLLGALFLGGVGAVIGFVVAFTIASLTIHEKLHPEKYQLREGSCPHCGSPVKWRPSYIKGNAFTCFVCKGRIILIDGTPRTPAQAKELQSRQTT